ncbi:hypothetical protein [Rhizobium mulingense]|uniref:hypothetical protein n=1 Tax=Rhizobium mulingense TaxID=3031128 RepID=UPI002B48E55B|nr:hypothetical protein [Rhizobium sp. MJ21]MEB3045640.1 hypothetical protein [Rhizobium sp. MJ21]
MQATETELREDLLWGALAIAQYIGRSQRSTYHMLEQGQLPARKVGELWVGSKTTLRGHLAGEQP